MNHIEILLKDYKIRAKENKKQRKIEYYIADHKKLFPIKKEPKYKDFGVFDIEASEWTHYIISGYKDKNQTKYFVRIPDFVKFLELNEVENIIFSHNGGGYDFLFIIDYVSRYRKNLLKKPLIVKAGKVIEFTLSFNDKEITFKDSIALLPFSLKTLTDKFSTATKKLEYDYTKLDSISFKKTGLFVDFNNLDANQKELVEYLEADLNGLFEVLTKFYNHELIKKSGQAFTTAGQAMKVFRTYLDYPIDNLPKTIERKIRDSYFGGRTEIFKPYYEDKKDFLYCYDINSLYPYVMNKYSYPIKFSHFTKIYDKKACGFYDLEIKAPDDLYVPVLPIKQDKKLIFPLGTIKGVYTIPEINKALEKGYKIININRGYIFKSKNIFKSFIDDLYKLRKESSDEFNNVIYKLLMNSLYGKFGMRLNVENVVIDNGDSDIIPFPFLNGLFGRKPDVIDTFNNVAIASYVTSYARLELYKRIEDTNNDIYYCDTDSIFTTKELKTGSELGNIKLEYKAKNMCFLVPKTYIASDVEGINKKTILKLKGFDKNTSNFDINTFKEALRGELELIKATKKKPLKSFKQALNSGSILSLAEFEEKSLKNPYSKREYIKSDDLKNWDTKPIYI